MKAILVLLRLILLISASAYKNVPKQYGSTLEPAGETAKKVFYKSSNSAYYEDAQEDCRLVLGGTLARIQEDDDIKGIRKAIQGEAISSLWVGATVRADVPQCHKPQNFDDKCWVWSETCNEPINSSVISWNPYSNSQNVFSRAVLSTIKQVLTIKANTTTERYICEILKTGESKIPCPCTCSNN